MNELIQQIKFAHASLERLHQIDAAPSSASGALDDVSNWMHNETPALSVETAIEYIDTTDEPPEVLATVKRELKQVLRRLEGWAESMEDENPDGVLYGVVLFLRDDLDECLNTLEESIQRLQEYEDEKLSF